MQSCGGRATIFSTPSAPAQARHANRIRPGEILRALQQQGHLRLKVSELIFGGTQHGNGKKATYAPFTFLRNIMQSCCGFVVRDLVALSSAVKLQTRQTAEGCNVGRGSHSLRQYGKSFEEGRPQSLSPKPMARA